MLASIAFVSEFTISKLVYHKRKNTLGDIIEDIIIYDVDINYMKAWVRSFL